MQTYYRLKTDLSFVPHAKQVCRDAEIM